MSIIFFQMALVFNESGLSSIETPCVAQTFINHDAVLYKIFVIGKHYTVVERPSLKNFEAEEGEFINLTPCETAYLYAF